MRAKRRDLRAKGGISGGKERELFPRRGEKTEEEEEEEIRKE